MSTKVKIPNSTDNDIRFAGLRDVVQVYDPYKKSWQDWRRTGVVILPSTIIVTTTTLNGKPVTCQINEESYTTTFIDGAAHFRVLSTGTATITCGEYSVEVEVTQENGEYTAEIEEIIKIDLIQNGSIVNGEYTSLNGRLTYKATKGDFTGRSLGIEYTSSDSMVCCCLAPGIKEGTYGYLYLKPDGTVNGEIFQTYSYATAGTKIYPFSRIAALQSGIDTDDKITHFVVYVADSTGSDLQLTNFIRNMWLE